MEGVMMRHKNRYAVAVRKSDRTIEVMTEEHISYGQKFHVSDIPVIRGVFAFIDSMVLGMQTLTWSASFFDEEEKPEKEDREKSETSDKLFMAATVALSLILSIGLFMVLPFFISGLFRKVTDSSLILGIVEGVVRVLIFVGYILGISRMKDIQRLFRCV